MSEFIRRSLEAHYGRSGEAKGGEMSDRGTKAEVLRELAEMKGELENAAVDLNTLGGEVGRASIVRQKMLAEIQADVVLPLVDEFERHRKILTEVDFRNLQGLTDLESQLDRHASQLHYLRNLVAQLFESFDRQAGHQFTKLTAELEALKARAKEHACNNESVREQVWAITGGRCYYCEVELVKSAPIDYANPGSRGNIFHVDHLVPRDAGGPDHLSNYVPACHSCNSSKGVKSFVEFTRSRRAKLTVIEGDAA